MKWITRANVKVDRVACPWLILRFIDAQAEFLFVPEDQLLETARREGAIPFDATRFPEVKLNHRRERCTFEALLEDYRLSDPALHRLALIVRGADVKGQEHLCCESLGLRAIAQGVAHPGKREALSDRAQAETLAAERLLSFHVGTADDQRETVKRWITEAVVVQKGLERTALSTMIQLHFGKPGCVKRDRPFSARGFEKLLFGHE